MPFDPTPIIDTTVRRSGDLLAVAWDSSAPDGSTYQVYVDRVFAWSGQATACRLPWPRSRVWIEVGVVEPGEITDDFAATLDPNPASRAVLTWLGGTYLSTDISHFAVYCSTIPGGPANMSRSVATVAAYDAGIVTDGFGFGGFGLGGFGLGAASYTWTSPPLAPGVWSFVVLAVDDAGHTSPAAAATVTVVGPPAPPAANAYSQRLTYSLDLTTGIATLNWLPSPA